VGRAAALGAALALACPAPVGAQPWVQIRSGLPWASGAIEPGPGFEDWRGGRKLDVRTVFFGRKDWAHLVSSGLAIEWAKNLGGHVVAAIGMLPNTHKGQLEQCAAGAFDAQIRALTANMLRKGGQALADRGKAIIVRLGWEANLATSVWPWRVTGDGASWRGCFRRWVDILNPKVDRDGDPATPPARLHRFTITWNMANRGTFPHPIENMWPGGDYVDIVGSQFYDRCPTVTENDEAAWQRRISGRDRWGNPAGPQGWLAFAKAKGKKYAIPEWGIGGPNTIRCRDTGHDNPYFVRKTFEFLTANAADIAYEAYFNGHGGATPAIGSHKIFAPEPLNPTPTAAGYLAYVGRYNPRAATAYRRLWGAGP
jgi:hypothetical protein